MLCRSGCHNKMRQSVQCVPSNKISKWCLIIFERNIPLKDLFLSRRKKKQQQKQTQVSDVCFLTKRNGEFCISSLGVSIGFIAAKESMGPLWGDFWRQHSWPGTTGYRVRNADVRNRPIDGPTLYWSQLLNSISKTKEKVNKQLNNDVYCFILFLGNCIDYMVSSWSDSWYVVHVVVWLWFTLRGRQINCLPCRCTSFSSEVQSKNDYTPEMLKP